jgi:hypothetical protein
LARFTTEKPQAALFVPQAACQMTDSEADDTGHVRAHAEASINATASGEVNLANRSG